MFHAWRERTLRDGARGRGTVVDASHETDWGVRVASTVPLEYKRTIRMTFPDGSTSDTQETIPLHSVQKLADRRTIDCWPQIGERTKVGATVPVRYDESDHSHVVLDLPALLEEIFTSLDQSADA